MNVVSTNAKFSYNYIKGSIKSRRKLVSGLNEQFFDSFFKLSENKKVSAKDLKQIFLKLLPERKYIEIKKFKLCDNHLAASDYVYNEDNGNILGLTLELPFLNSKLQTFDIPTLMHETTHVLATLANPKHTVLTQKLNKVGKYSNSYDNWYQKVLYTDEKITEHYTVKDMLESVKESTLHFLEGKTSRDKIDFLQDARYQLEQELDAHNEQLKFARKLKDMGLEVNKEDLIDENKFFFFSEKIELLNKMLFDVINKVRQKNAAKIKRKSLSLNG